MGKINVLDFEIANLIAAGEVVERPSSVMKELIENSIDAGATQIVAEIKHGGVALIRVSDNGCGMEPEDLPVALKRHATSKIKSREDLSAIMSLGFRGEALAAISSVSSVTIITKTAEAASASMLTSEGGRVLDVCEVGAADGTTVVVENLFFNVPARRKFLKKDVTEAQNVAALVEKVALSRPEISIQLLIDGQERFRTPGDGKPENAIYAIYGKEFAARILPVEGNTGGISVRGFVGRSDNVRKNRNYENFFINHRYVRSLTAQAALEKAFTSYIASDSFPACVLYLDINPALVDVNVHPAKLEVKFSDERSVFEAVYYTVRAALEKAAYRPELSLERPDARPRPVGQTMPGGAQISLPRPGGAAPLPPRDRPASHGTPRADTLLSFGSGAGDSLRTSGARLSPSESLELLRRYDSARAATPPPSAAPAGSHAPAQDPAPAQTASPKGNPAPAGKDATAPQPTLKPSPAPAPHPAPESAAPAPEYRYVGEAFDCYVIVEYEGDLLLIDKHAAHERVIFEQLKRRLREDFRVGSQMLLVPLSVSLTPEESSAAAEYRGDLEAVGFGFTLSGNTVAVTAVPDAVSPFDAEGLFVGMCDELAEGQGSPANTESIRRERGLYRIACKAAIKGGRTYDRSVIDWLVTELLRLPDITVCPHGRPVAYKITKRELDRQFDRIK